MSAPTRAEVAAALKFYEWLRPPDKEKPGVAHTPGSQETTSGNRDDSAIERARDRKIARLASRGIKYLEHGHPDQCRDCFRRLAGLIAERPLERVVQLEVQRGLR